MQILPSELIALGYRQSGMVRPDPAPVHFSGRKGRGLFTVETNLPVDGWVTYVHVLEDECKKAGKTENDKSLAGRMRSSYDALRRTIELMNNRALCYVADVLYRVDPMTGEPIEPYEEDFPWKHRIPPVLMPGPTVILWAKPHSTWQSMHDEEIALNNRYRGEWAKERWSKLRTPEGRLVRMRLQPGPG